MHNSHKYETHLKWTGAASGPVSSYESYSREYVVSAPGKTPLAGSADTIFRGDATRYNPEDMLVASLSGCHMLSFLADAARAGVRVVAYEDRASGTLVLQQGGGHFTEVILRPHVTVEGGDAETVQKLHERAHENCFVASSMNFPVRHEATTTVL